MHSSCPCRTKFSLLPSSLKWKCYAAILEKDSKDDWTYVTVYVIKTNKKDIVADKAIHIVQQVEQLTLNLIGVHLQRLVL